MEYYIAVYTNPQSQRTLIALIQAESHHNADKLAREKAPGGWRPYSVEWISRKELEKQNFIQIYCD